MRVSPIIAASAAIVSLLGPCAVLAKEAPLEASASVAAAADSVAPPARVANFRLQDQNLKTHELYALSNAKAVVIVTQGVGCPISRNVNPTLIGLQKAYASRGVEFLLLNSNLHDTRDSIVTEAKEFGFTMPVLMDTTQAVGEQLGVSRTATVYVIDPKTWKIAYRGPVDDRVTYERQRASATERWAEEALEVVLTGKGRISQADRPAEGCLINFEKRDAADDQEAHSHEGHQGH